MIKNNFTVIKYPECKFYKDEGGKNSCLSFEISFLNKIKFNENDIKINIYSGNILINSESKNSEFFKILNIKINTKTNNMIVNFRFEKVSRRFDHKEFIVEIHSEYFIPIKSKPIYVLSKRKKRKRINTDEHFSDTHKKISMLDKKVQKLEKMLKLSEDKINELNDLINYVNDIITVESFSFDDF